MPKIQVTVSDGVFAQLSEKARFDGQSVSAVARWSIAKGLNYGPRQSWILRQVQRGATHDAIVSKLAPCGPWAVPTEDAEVTAAIPLDPVGLGQRVGTFGDAIKEAWENPVRAFTDAMERVYSGTAPTPPACEHEWVFLPALGMNGCSKCGYVPNDPRSDRDQYSNPVNVICHPQGEELYRRVYGLPHKDPVGLGQRVNRIESTGPDILDTRTCQGCGAVVTMARRLFPNGAFVCSGCQSTATTTPPACEHDWDVRIGRQTAECLKCGKVKGL